MASLHLWAKKSKKVTCPSSTWWIESTCPTGKSTEVIPSFQTWYSLHSENVNNFFLLTERECHSGGISPQVFSLWFLLQRLPLIRNISLQRHFLTSHVQTVTTSLNHFNCANGKGGFYSYWLFSRFHNASRLSPSPPPPQILHMYCFEFLLRLTSVLREVKTILM